LVVSYLWGGCVSCEQFFMLPGSKGHCCQARRCKSPVNKSTDRRGSETTQQDCQTMPLERSSGAHSPSALAAALRTIPVAAIPDADVIDLTRNQLTRHQVRMAIEFDPSAGSPPDIPVINAALLI
jgi:hypothetical protein